MSDVKPFTSPEEIAAALEDHHGFRAVGDLGKYHCLTCKVPDPCSVARALVSEFFKRALLDERKD